MYLAHVIFYFMIVTKITINLWTITFSCNVLPPIGVFITFRMHCCHNKMYPIAHFSYCMSHIPSILFSNSSTIPRPLRLFVKCLLTPNASTITFLWHLYVSIVG
jgi:hypothetical protein